MAAPLPPSPEKTLKRVLLIAGIDGWSIIAIAGLGSLLTLVLGDFSSLIVGGLVLAAGVMELRGRGRLRRRDPAGLQAMVKAQFFLLAVILVYCASRLGSYDQESMLANLTPDMRAALKESGIEVADIIPLVRTAFFALYGILAFLTVVFQGGLILYYRSRAKLVTAALVRPPEPPSQAVF